MTIMNLLHNTRFQKVLVYCCAIVPGFFAVAWTYTFGFTEYRHHLAFIGLPLGLAMAVLAIAMVLMKRWAIVISIALTAIVSVAAAGIFFISRHPFHVAVVVIGMIYTYSSILYLRQKTSKI
jgi:hypothetical protein